MKWGDILFCGADVRPSQIRDHFVTPEPIAEFSINLIGYTSYQDDVQNPCLDMRVQGQGHSQGLKVTWIFFVCFVTLKLLEGLSNYFLSIQHVTRYYACVQEHLTQEHLKKYY